MKIDHKAERQGAINKGDPRPDGEISPEMSADRPTTEDIANLAYALWQERGCPDGNPEEDWYQAENRLYSRR